MNRTFRASSMTQWMRRVAIPLLILTALVVAPTPAVAAPTEGHRASTTVTRGDVSGGHCEGPGFNLLRGRSVCG